jgi:hypothetical protein
MSQKRQRPAREAEHQDIVIQFVLGSGQQIYTTSTQPLPHLGAVRAAAKVAIVEAALVAALPRRATNRLIQHIKREGA